MSEESEFSDSESYPFILSDKNNISDVSSEISKLICSGENKSDEEVEIEPPMLEPQTEQPKRGYVSSKEKTRGTRRKRKEINYCEENEEKIESSENYSENEIQQDSKRGSRRGRGCRGRGRGGRPRGRARRKELEEHKESIKYSKIEANDETEKDNETNVDYLLDFHHEICYECNEGGELILCDKCPKAFHPECTKNKVDYARQWECDNCNGCLKNICHLCSKFCDSNDSNLKGNNRAILECPVCKCVTHFKCCEIPFLLIINSPYYLNIPQEEKDKLIKLFKENSLSSNEKIYKLCNYCQEARGVEFIIESIKTEKIESEFCVSDENYNLEFLAECSETKDKGTTPSSKCSDQGSIEGEINAYYLVKFKGISYLHSPWVDEVFLECISKIKYENFLSRKKEIEEANEILLESDEQDDMYYYGIYKLYLEPDRIIDVCKFNNEEILYLIKWSELEYDQCTWLYNDFIELRYPELKKKYQRIQKIEDKCKNKSKIRKRLMRTCENGRENEFVAFDIQPEFIKSGELYDYQLKGLNWLAYSWHQSNNVILADEMGLGKTIQTSCFLNYLMTVHTISRPYLICVPLSTLHNWQRELKKWLPQAYVVVLYGNKKSRKIVFEKEFNMRDPEIKHIRKFNVLLVTYEVILQEQSTLIKTDWRAVIIDEGQRLKSNKSKFYEKASQLNSEFRVLLSGTPLQNNFDELLNLCRFISPEKFNDSFNQELRELFNQSLLAKARKDTSYKSHSDKLEYNEKDVEKETDLVNTLHMHLGCHLLRRRKKDVLKSLPKKKEVLINVYLTKRQRQIYKLIFMKNYEALTFLEKNSYKNTKISLKSATNILMYLRLCCNHPFLLTRKYNPGIKAGDSLNDETEEDITLDDIVQSSGKMKVLNQMLPRLLNEGHKVLIFSQFKLMLNIVEDYLIQMDFKYLRLDGETKSFMRQRLIDTFNKEDSQYKVFILSTRAGGLGINLHTADTIFIIDSDFNPHNDLQALSRAHRIGQKNNVLIFRLISRSTCEEKLIETAQHKLLLGGLYVQRDKRIKSLDTENNKSSITIEAKEMDQVLKYGVNIIFKESDDNSYNDKDFNEEEINELLDRDKHFKEELEKPDDENEIDDYFSAFKVAQMKDKVEGHKIDEKKSETQHTMQSWREIIGEDVEKIQIKELENLGKGKRKRAKVKYNEGRQKTMPSEESSSVEEPSDGEGDDETTKPDVFDETDITDFTDNEVLKIVEKSESDVKDMQSYLSKVKNLSVCCKIFHSGFSDSELYNIQNLFPNHRSLNPNSLTLPLIRSYSLNKNNLKDDLKKSRWMMNMNKYKTDPINPNKICFRNHLLYFLEKDQYPSNWLNIEKIKSLSNSIPQKKEHVNLEYPIDQICNLTSNRNIINAIIMHNHFHHYDHDSVIYSNFNNGERQEFMKFVLMYGLSTRDKNFLYNKLNHCYSKHFNTLIFKKQFDFYEYTAFICDFLLVLNHLDSTRNLPHYLLNYKSSKQVIERIENISLLRAIYNEYKIFPNQFIIETSEYFESFKKNQFKWNLYDDFLLIVNILDYGYDQWSLISNSNRWLLTFECDEIYNIDPNSKAFNEKWQNYCVGIYNEPWEILHHKITNELIQNLRIEIFKKAKNKTICLQDVIKQKKYECEKFLEQRTFFLIDCLKNPIFYGRLQRSM